MLLHTQGTPPAYSRRAVIGIRHVWHQTAWESLLARVSVRARGHSAARLSVIQTERQVPRRPSTSVTGIPNPGNGTMAPATHSSIIGG